MRNLRFQLYLLSLALILMGPAVLSDEDKSDGQSVSATTALARGFALKTLDGQLVTVGNASAANPSDQTSTKDRVRATVICFLGTECPLVKLYSRRLSDMADLLQADGVRFVGVNSNRQDTVEDIRNYLQQHELTFPLVLDPGNVVADAFQASRTPEVVVLNSDLQIVYRGRIDDQYEPGVNRPAATRDDLLIAVQETLANKPVSIPFTQAVGCMIGKVKRPSIAMESVAVEDRVTFCNQVIRVLQQHCIECHRTGEIGPFALDNYDDAVGWIETSLEVIDQGRMPPWGADPKVGHFANARDMADRDKQILRDWVAQGMPKGDESLMPELPEYPSGWQLEREPDLVLPMRSHPYNVAAEGTIEYQYFVVDPGFEEDRWISGAQIMPGNAAVVHHAIVFIRPPDGGEFRGIGMLTAYVPGQRLVPVPAGHARKIPAGSRLVFQMHYTANGAPQQDISQVGLVFAAPQQVTHQVISLIGIDQEFEIPPHAENHEVEGRLRWLPKGGRLLGLAPHMHVRGKSFSIHAERNGQTETLLSVPQYDFNWQHNYVLAQPLELDEYDGIRFTATFDNSRNNPFNPDPSEWVNWGDQTWEEMAVVFLEVAEPLIRNEHAKQNLSRNDTMSSGDTQAAGDTAASRDTAAQAEREKKILAFVDDFFAHEDKNGDGIVLRNEVPLVIKSRFGRYDLDGNGQITRAEIREMAETIF